MTIKELIKKSIDLHVHIGPEIIPRKFTLAELVSYEQGKISGIAVKNHFFPTIMANNEKTMNSKFPLIINSVVLNHYVGGFNPDVIRATSSLSKNRTLVWFPTIHAKKFLDGQKFEVDPKWISENRRNNIQIPLATEIEGLSVFSQGKLLKNDVIEVLKVIKETDSILATGHLSWEESEVLVQTASELGIKRLIITHPIYQRINMPIEVQKKLGKLGAFNEISYSMISIDKISIQEITNQIQKVGPEFCIISSDVGQAFSKSPSEALEEFLLLLVDNNIPLKDLKTMLVENPTKLVE